MAEHRGVDPALLVIHGLRIRGRATTDGLVELYHPLGLDVATADTHLDRLAQASLARQRTGRWALINPAGLRYHRQVIDDEVDGAGARDTVDAALAAFEAPNTEALGAFSRYQLGESSHDAVVDELDALVVAVIGGVIGPAANALWRFSVHQQRLRRAARRANEDPRWIAAPLIDSVHTSWFELHEDLLTTVGRTRAR